MSSNRKILLVDDNDLSRDLLCRRLQRRGFEVVTARDGGQAVSLAHSERPDVILMDISLPVMDGWSATREIKGHADTGRIPVIALTAYDDAVVETRAREVGCDDFEVKPFQFPALLDKIARVLPEAL